MANIQIPITENGTVTLATAGKYCDRNIDVNVNVAGGTSDRYEEGKQAEYDAFWDVYQQNGNRTYYRFGFCGSGWCADTFKPKYPITISGNGEYAFGLFDYQAPDRENLVDLSVLNIDWSKVTSFSRTFYSANLLDTGFVDTTGCTTLSSTFASAASKGFITKITLKVKASTTYTTPFNSQPHLTDLMFTEDSVIGNSGIDLSDSKLLSKASFQSAINALSSTASGKSITFSKTARENAFTDEEWSALVATKTNWTISLE